MIKMEIVPAIDLSNGKCVRLTKGEKGTEKVYYEDPMDALAFWESYSVKRLHFVDLDGAWGEDKNKSLLKTMIKKASCKVQIGGGIRTVNQALKLIDIGADRVIIGTLAIKNPAAIKELSEKIGSERIMVALDYKGGKIATHGWTEVTNENPFEFGKRIGKYGAGYILFSSVEADGAFLGPDIENIKKMKESADIPIYAAGGIRNEEDIKKLEEIDIYGVVIGKAFYEGKIDPLILTRV